MGLLKDGVELAGQLIKWARIKIQSSEWERRLAEANRQLLMRKADTEAAQLLVELAMEAGYSSRTLHAFQKRLQQIIDSGIDSDGRYAPPVLEPGRKPMGGIRTVSVTKAKKKKVSRKPVAKKKSLAAKKKPRYSTAKKHTRSSVRRAPRKATRH